MTYHVEYILEFYRDHRGCCPVGEFLASLPEKPRAKVSAWLSRLQQCGPDMPRPYADVLSGDIRELRISFGRMEMRVLYFITRHNIVATQGFLKKERRIDPEEILRARRRRDRWMLEHGDIRLYEA
jgi:phage-related protein